MGRVTVDGRAGTSSSRSRSSAVSVQWAAARSAIVVTDAVSAAAIPAIRVFSIPERRFRSRSSPQVSRDRDAATDVEGARARWPAELVRRQRRQVRAEGGCVRREPAHGLAGVGVEPHARSARGRAASATGWMVPSSWFACWTDARSVPGARTSAAKRSRSTDRLRRRGRPAPRTRPTERVRDAAHGRMLDGADHVGTQLADGADTAPDREGDRFGAAGGEHDLVGLSPDRGGDLLASVVEQRAGRTARGVDRAGRRTNRGRRRRPRATGSNGVAEAESRYRSATIAGPEYRAGPGAYGVAGSRPRRSTAV